MITSLEILSIIPDEIKSEEVKEYEQNQREWQGFWSEVLQDAAENMCKTLEETIMNAVDDIENSGTNREYIATYWDELDCAYSYQYLHSDKELLKFLFDNERVLTVIDITNAPVMFQRSLEEDDL